MAQIIGIRKHNGTSRKTGEVLDFWSVYAEPEERDEKLIGTQVDTYVLFDEEQADDIKIRLRESINAGKGFITGKIYSHFSDQRNIIAYVKFDS